MAVTVSKTIGSAGGRDYSTIQAWEDACPANLVAVDQVWKGLCYYDTPFGEQVMIAGITTDTSRYLWLTTGPGQAFCDSPTIRTTNLAFGSSPGVILSRTADYETPLTANGPRVLVEGLQIRSTTGGSASVGVVQNGARIIFRNCILTGGVIFTSVDSGIDAINCLILSQNLLYRQYTTVNGSLVYCTVVRSSPGGSPGTVNYSTLDIRNCAFFNFADPILVSPVLTGGWNCTDLGTAPGANNQTLKVFADQFVNTISDFRAKDTSDLASHGSAYTSAATDDISRTPRGATPTIGCWELAAVTEVPAPAAQPFILFPV